MSDPVPTQTTATTTANSAVMTFEEWCIQLDKLGAAEPYRFGPTPVESCGAACWRDYYDDGYSPAAAWAEDGTYD